MLKIEHIDHVALTVKDLPRSVACYTDILGLERRYEATWGDAPTMLCVGDTCLALFAAHTVTPAPSPDPDVTLIMKHLAFRVDRANFELAQHTLQQHDITFSFEDHTISHSIYFHDPDDYRLELTTWDV